MSTQSEVWLVVAVVMLNAYSVGANCVERFVNYASWPQLKDSDFAAYYRAQQPSILIFVVAPLALSAFLQVLLLLNRPPQLEAPLVWTVLIASLLGAMSTALMPAMERSVSHDQIPRLEREFVYLTKL